MYISLSSLIFCDINTLKCSYHIVPCMCPIFDINIDTIVSNIPSESKNIIKIKFVIVLMNIIEKCFRLTSSLKIVVLRIVFFKFSFDAQQMINN